MTCLIWATPERVDEERESMKTARRSAVEVDQTTATFALFALVWLAFVGLAAFKEHATITAVAVAAPPVCLALA